MVGPILLGICNTGWLIGAGEGLAELVIEARLVSLFPL